MSQSTSCPDDSFGPWAGSECRGGFDFTLLFEESILALPLDAIFLLAAAVAARRRIFKDVKVDKSFDNRIRIICKLGTALCIALLRLTLIFQWSDSGSEAGMFRTRVSVPAAAVSFAAAVAYLLLSWQEHVKSVRPSFEIEMYLAFSTLLNLARIRTLWLMQDTISIAAVSTVCMIIQLFGILFESWNKRHVLREPFSKWTAESLGGTFSRSVFFWLNPLLVLGSRQLLALSDLPPLDTKLECDKLQAEFQEVWNNVPDKSKSGALLSAWLSAHSKYVLAGVIPKLCQIAFLFVQPLLVERAILFAASPNQTEYNNVGYGLIGAYALVYTGIAVSTGQVQWRMVRATAYMRAAILPCITSKTLRIDLAQASSASALTLISTDIETIDGGVAAIHELWGPFIEIGLGAYLLWRQIGSAMGIPISVVFLVLIIALFMAVPVGMRLAAWIKASEERIAATSQTLGNVKSYRMAGLNDIAFAAIEKLRVHELEVSRTFRYWFGAATILPLCLPALNPVLSFAGFTGLNSGLSIGQALTSLSLLALLNRPLSNLSISLPAVAGAVASFDRVQEYLNADEKEDKRICTRPWLALSHAEKFNSAKQSNESVGLGLGNANEKANPWGASSESLPLANGVMVEVDGTFTWPESEKPALDIRELNIPASAVTVLLGPTGCGKTTLLNIILGELRAFEGLIRMASLDISYCAQKPWLLNGTIRDAIVGKLDYDEEWYSRTIHACALDQDFASLAEGDQSLLGNKGSQLSGGQKQRVAIARAVYSRRQICVFDDVFKGLDNTTAKKVMEALLGPHGLLRSGGLTSIVSTSDKSCVSYADHVVLMDQDGEISFQGPRYESRTVLGSGAPETKPDEETANSLDKEVSLTSQNLPNGINNGEESFVAAEDLQYLLSFYASERRRASQRPVQPPPEHWARSVAISRQSARMNRQSMFLNRQSMFSNRQSVLMSQPSVFSNPQSTLSNRQSVVTSSSTHEQEELDEAAMNDLTRQTGDSTVHKYYFHAAGIKSALVFLAALVVGAFTDTFSQIWVVWWTDAIAKDPNTSTGKWLGVYAALGIAGILGNLIAAWEIFIVVIQKTGMYFHSMLVQTVSRAPMSFFNTVDQGVTLNRFSQDMQLIDMELPASALGAAVSIANVLGQCALIGVTGRYIAIAIPFIIVVFYLVQKFYLRTSRQMRFLDIEHKAPLYSQTIETLDGLASIRAFGFESRIMTAICKSLDDSQRPVYLLACLQQWLLFVSDMTVAVLAVLTITITATLREQIGVGFMGLALSNLVSFSTTVQMLLVTWVQLEISIGAVARVKRFTDSLGLEKTEESSSGPPGDDWPWRGKVSFRNVSVSYPGAGRKLHGINLEIPAGYKVGVCGRTGSGKSSLASTLFKLVDLEQGSIMIDGVDIATVEHETLRKSIVGVPQDFLTLDGTLRLNVDPRGTKSDEEIIQILQTANLWAALEPRGGLDLVISEATLSFGELQLLAFTRAMVCESRVLVLDEISSSMDEANSKVVDGLIRTWFQDWTIITVAHKLESIRHFDRIVVLDAGRVVEYDSPDRLLAKPTSLFKKLYESDLTQ